MLDKRLQLGGLQVGGPRTAQNAARFRIADNVYQTKDGYIVPRADCQSYLSGFVGSLFMSNVFRYKSKPFTLGYGSTSYLPYYESTSVLPNIGMPTLTGSLGVQAEEKVGNLYMHFPNKGLFKYDGYQVYRAGTPLPWVYGVSLGSGYSECFMTAVQHHIDQQGNIVNSGYVRGTIRYNTTTGAFSLGTDKLNASFSPDSFSRDPLDFPTEANGYPAYYAKTVSSVYSGNNLVVTTGGYQFVKDGFWLIGRSDLVIYDGVETRGLAYRVLSHTSTTVTFDKMRYMDGEGVWRDWTGGVSGIMVPSMGAGQLFAFYWISVWTCTNETGNYAYQGLVPACYESPSSTKQFGLTLSNPADPNFPGTPGRGMFNLSGNLGDIYDLTTSKTVFPASGQLLPKSFSSNASAALISYDNVVYFSDFSEGGCYEMTEGLAFFTAGEEDDGEIQVVCGNAQFILISRKFRNYYLSGNILTGNYQVSEIGQTSLGCYSNESVISLSDKIIFLNKQGIWALYSGGRCEEVSLYIQGLFDNFSNTKSFEEESYFDLDSFPTYADINVNNQWIKARLDLNRNLLAFLIYGGTGVGAALVLNLNNGEFTTWSHLNSLTPPNFQDLCFIDGQYYKTHNGSGQKAVFKEQKNDYTYMSTSPVKLRTTWFTAGEPSLEKKLNQVKLWGIIDPPTQVTLSHCLDWKETSPVSDDTYSNTTVGQFSHKKRLTPGNFQGVSVGMDFVGNFQIEGVEIEYQGLQEGMKR